MIIWQCKNCDEEFWTSSDYNNSPTCPNCKKDDLENLGKTKNNETIDFTNQFETACGIIKLLLGYLPDSTTQESPDNWKWCWNELDDQSQEEVKMARQKAQKFLEK